MQLTKAKFVAGAVAATAAAAVVALSGAANAAPAVTAYTVAGGGTGGAVTLTNSGNLVFKDTSTGGGSILTCTGFSAPGHANVGAHTSFAPATPPTAPPLDAALTTTLTSSSLSGCSNVTVGATTITPSGTWSFGVVSKSGTTATGYLDFVSAHVAAATCVFDAKGYIPGSYDSTTGKFTAASTPSGLVISNVSGSGCNLVHVVNGHTANLTGVIVISPLVTIS